MIGSGGISREDGIHIYHGIVIGFVLCSAVLQESEPRKSNIGNDQFLVSIGIRIIHETRCPTGVTWFQLVFIWTFTQRDRIVETLIKISITDIHDLKFEGVAIPTFFDAHIFEQSVCKIALIVRQNIQIAISIDIRNFGHVEFGKAQRVV